MDYQPINCSFHDVLLDNATKKKYHKIQYFTDLHEFITTDSIIKDVFTENKEEFLVLITDEVIRLDKIVSVGGVFQPKYAHIQDFSCDC